MAAQRTTPIRVTVWGENRHEQVDESVARIYPDGMHTTIAAGIVEHLGDGCVVRTATLDDPEHGLTDEVLEQTDVLTWWGHAAHDEVRDEVVERVHRHVLVRHGPGRPPLRSLVQGLHDPHGDHVHAPVAGRPRPRAGLDRRPHPPDRPRRPAPASSSTRRRCTASSSTSPRRTSWSSSAPSAAARCSAPAARSAAATARSSTSGRATRSTRPTTTRTCDGSSRTPSSGPSPTVGAGASPPCGVTRPASCFAAEPGSDG